jgi:pimeloyl-ACP methyl ester carboxylesterase
MPDRVFVLVHSPSVGPATWSAVAAELRSTGNEVLVPSLLTVAAAAPPFWPEAVRCVRESLRGAPDGAPVTLVLHSNAGLLAPVLVDGLGSRVEAIVFVDAGLPERDGPTAMASAEFLPFLREKAVNGLLPPWTDWWDEADVAVLFPDEDTRQKISAEQPRLPLAYFETMIPHVAGWDQRRCGYVVFNDAYREQGLDAHARGWPVREVQGEHLHMLVDPVATAAAIKAVSAS